MRSERIKFGIIGTNFISEWFCSAARETLSAEVGAVYSRTRERGEAFAADMGIPKVYTSLDEMLGDESLTAIYVASPTICHKEHSLRALKSGKPVLTEKMISTDYAEFLEMKKAAEDAGLVLLEAMRPDFDELLTLLPTLIPKIGKIREVKFEYCQYSSRYDRFKMGITENAFRPDMKNSALADIGIYPLHLAISLFGEPVSISSSSEFLENGFEGRGNITLSYEGFNVDISYSKIHEGENISRIAAEGGTLSFDKINAPTQLLLHGSDGVLTESYSRKTNNIALEIDAFCECVRGERDFRTYLRVSEKTMKAVDEIYKKSKIFG